MSAEADGSRTEAPSLDRTLEASGKKIHYIGIDQQAIDRVNKKFGTTFIGLTIKAFEDGWAYETPEKLAWIIGGYMALYGLCLFSMLFFTFGLQAWFSDQVRTAVNTSLQVAQAYLDYLYSEDELGEWAGPLRELAEGAEEVYVLFNNNRWSRTASGELAAQAPANALALQRILAGSGVPTA